MKMLLRPVLSENAMGSSGTGRSAGSEAPNSNRIGVLPPGVYMGPPLEKAPAKLIRPGRYAILSPGGTRRMDEKELKELLLRENADFRRAHDDHRACEQALDAIRAKPRLTPAEADEERELKKRKLALKDRMYLLMADYLRTR